MLHIVYSNKINLNKLKFVNAFSDALDIDVSADIRVTNSEFINPLNDSIDFMESNARVENCTIVGSGDKGISIGENSNIYVLNTSLKKNNIGIAVKDNSMANISTSKFSDNTIHISAYKKNWQYGSAGYVNIKKSLFDGPMNTFISLDNSRLNISNSVIEGPKFLDGENIIFN
jgi:type 1 fimbria pilin